jgi:hypothetical protein
MFFVHDAEVNSQVLGSQQISTKLFGVDGHSPVVGQEWINGETLSDNNKVRVV